jgi:magnesium transporter
MDEDIEESARFYEDNGEPHIRSELLVADEDDPRTVRVAFILNLVNDDPEKGAVFIHDEDVPCFACCCGRAGRRG